jgi:heme-degrading monooxygenase HmoA
VFLDDWMSDVGRRNSNRPTKRAQYLMDQYNFSPMAAMSVIEIVSFPPAPTCQQDARSALSALGELLAGAPASDGLYFGPDSEQDNLSHFFIPWESVEAHKEFMKLPEFAAAVPNFKTAFAEEPKFYHVVLTPESTVPSKLLASSIVEVVLLTPKAAESIASVHSAASKVLEKMPGLTALGDAVEKENTVVALLSWKSVEEAKEFAKTDGFKSVFGELLKVADLASQYFVKVSKF